MEESSATVEATDTDNNENNATSNDNGEEDDEIDIAFAAEAAANAVEEADAVEQQRWDEQILSCRICGQGMEEGRPILRFKPVNQDAIATTIPLGTVLSFTQDIALHIFCGKTASILPSVSKPEYEILTKAGLKNKHGIGPEVNAALARTRSATVNQEGTKEKQFYLVREFEAHLAAIRSQSQTNQTSRFVSSSLSNANATVTTISTTPASSNVPHHANSFLPQKQTKSFMGSSLPPTHLIHPNPAINTTNQQANISLPQASPGLLPPTSNLPQQVAALNPHQNFTQPLTIFNNTLPNTSNGGNSSKNKQIPVRAAAGAMPKPGQVVTQQQQQPRHCQPTLTEEGKVRCDCGGTHWPLGTTKGATSWRNHVMTKRHQKWMETNGFLGGV